MNGRSYLWKFEFETEHNVRVLFEITGDNFDNAYESAKRNVLHAGIIESTLIRVTSFSRG